MPAQPQTSYPYLILALLLIALIAVGAYLLRKKGREGEETSK